MCLPDIYTFAKSEVSEAVSQIAYHQPERRKEITQWFENLLKFFIQTEDDNVPDRTLLGFVVCNIMELKFTDLLPLIEKLYDQNKVDASVCGSYSTIKEVFYLKETPDNKNELLNIKERYNSLNKWFPEDFETEDIEEIPIKEPIYTPIK